MTTAGVRLRAAIEAERPLQVVGAVNAYAAMQAERAGFRALYLSGAGVANHSLGLPDLGVTNLGDVLTDTMRITAATDLPLLVDIDTGWGHAFTIDRAVRELERAGAAGVQIEDQAGAKRCGHRPNKQVVGAAEMVDRVRAAVAARRDPDFAIVARTDAPDAPERARAYEAAGADVIFAEAQTTLDDYRRVVEAVSIPVLANLTEFGLTPLYTLDELREAGVAIALYPLSASRAAARAAEQVYTAIRTQGTQRNVVDQMQTRDELYEVLDYLRFERAIDELDS
ncbi:MAG: 2-methylisocitrate lyase [Actinomycetia bacterium]|nr:2-methylisocitrate lyase [Actinomycetes bacterium]